MEIYNEGLGLNAKGLSLSVKRAKQILRIEDTPIDRTEDFNIDGSGAEDRRRKEKEITLSDDEERTAISQFCRGDAINPKTQRPYTEKEAIGVALEAKKGRPRRI